MTAFVGGNVTNSWTAAELAASGVGFKVGSRYVAPDGKEYVFVLAGSGGITGAGYVVTIDEDYGALMVSTSNDAHGDRIGVALGAVAASSYCWVQTRGVATIQVATSCAANARLNTTGTAGQLDDDGTTGAMQVFGVYLTTARGGSAGTAAGVLIGEPFISATL